MNQGEHGESAPRPDANPASLARRFQRDGFLAVRSLLAPGELDDIVRALEEFLSTVLPHLDPELSFYDDIEDDRSLKQVQQLHRHAPFVERLATEGKLPKLAQALLGEPVQIRNVQLFRKAPGVSRATPPHQDGDYFLLEPPQALTLWLALDPTDGGNGCLRYVRGSHRDGLRPHAPSSTLGFSRGLLDWSERDALREVSIPAHAGDLIAHHALTIHRADANLRGPIRRALGFVYYGRSAVEDVGARRERQARTYARWRSEGRLGESEQGGRRGPD